MYVTFSQLAALSRQYFFFEVSFYSIFKHMQREGQTEG